MEKDILANHTEILLIGGSAGSLEVIIRTLPMIRTDISFAIIIILHRKSYSDNTLVQLLRSKTQIPVKECDEKELILAGNIYVAPPDYHLLIEQDHTFSLDFSEKINYSRPSIDVTFQSAAETYRENVVALLLSGANADGVEGLELIRLTGGKVVVQDPETAEVSYMPQKALDKLVPDQILKIEEVAGFINSLN